MKLNAPTHNAACVPAIKACGAAILAVLLLPLVAGCLERTLKIRTQPANAIVIVNDEEVGPSPAKFSYTWYGDYELIIRKPGYETLKTNYRIDTPWYQIPPIDIVVEALIPVMFRDERETPVFVLSPATQPSEEDLMKRATELEDRALYED
jgi:hypothetical protein